MSRPVFEEPPMLFKQEQQSIQALEAFDRAASEFRASFGSGFGYTACAKRNRELAEAAQRVAAELHRTAACYELSASLPLRESEAPRARDVEAGERDLDVLRQVAEQRGGAS